MPSERAIVETLNRKELLELVSYFDLDVADRRVRDHLVDAIAMAPDLTLAEVLEQLPVATLKSVCSKHGLQVQGRGKAAYVASIAQVASPKGAAKGRTAGRIKAVGTPKASAKSAPKAAAGATATKKKAAARKPVKLSTVAAKATPKGKAAKAAKGASVAKATKAAAKTATKTAPKTAKKAAAAAPQSATKVARKSKVAKVASKSAVKPAPKAKSAPKAAAAAKKSKVAQGKVAQAKAAKVPKPKAAKGMAAKVTSIITEIVDLAEPIDTAPTALRAKRPRAAKAAKSVRAKTDTSTKQAEADVSKLGARAQPPAVKKAKAVALPQPPDAAPDAASSAPPTPPAPPPSNVIPLPYVNTPAAVAAAEAAATHLRATSDPSLWAQPTTRTQKCASCAAKLELRKCTAQKCNNMLVASPTRKICAECMFERNTLSMDDFNARMEEEANCPHCGKVWQKSS